MNDSPADESSPRWVLLRDVAAFQFKLLADALRELALSPVSILLAAADLVWPGKDRFYGLMALGRKSDRWINLFAAGPPSEPPDTNDWSIDEAVARIEASLRARYAEGGLTAQVVDKIDESLDNVQPRGGNRR